MRKALVLVGVLTIATQALALPPLTAQDMGDGIAPPAALVRASEMSGNVGRSVEGDTFDAVAMVQDGINAFWLDDYPDNFQFVAGTSTDNGANLITAADMEIAFTETMTAPNTYFVQANIYTVDGSPWVPVGALSPNGVVYNSWRMDVGIQGAGVDTLAPDLTGFTGINVLQSGQAAWDSTGLLGTFPLTLEGPYATNELGGVGVIGLGGADIGGFDYNEMALFWEYELVPEPASFLLLVLGAALIRRR